MLVLEHRDPAESRDEFNKPGTHSGAWSVLVTVEVRADTVLVTSEVAAAAIDANCAVVGSAMRATPLAAGTHDAWHST